MNVRTRKINRYTKQLKKNRRRRMKINNENTFIAYNHAIRQYIEKQIDDI